MPLEEYARAEAGQAEEFRLGDWFQSLKGHKIYPLDPRPSDVDIEEIAHALSHICRYGGHTPVFYSVAQHSLHVSECVAEQRPDLALEALLHDAAEAYLGDVIRPLKRGGAVAQVYLDAEKAWGRAIGVAIGMKNGGAELANLHPVVKIADDRLLLAERRDILAQTKIAWRERDYPPWERKIVPRCSITAKREFLKAFERLRR